MILSETGIETTAIGISSGADTAVILLVSILKIPLSVLQRLPSEAVPIVSAVSGLWKLSKNFLRTDEGTDLGIGFINLTYEVKSPINIH
jgi:hypothetical protein